MCMTRSGYQYNNNIPFADSQRLSNRENSVLPTPRGRIPEEMIMNPVRILNDPAFANDRLPTKNTT